MIEQLSAYEEKIREAELITGIKKQKVEAYNAYVANADQVLANDQLLANDTRRLELVIKRLEYIENLMAEEAALKIQEMYLEEDRKMFANIQKRRDEYMADIEAGEYEKAIEKLKEKIQGLKRKSGGKADTTALTNLLQDAAKVTTMEEQVDIYEQLKMYNK